jgi:hypothetical protein
MLQELLCYFDFLKKFYTLNSQPAFSVLVKKKKKHPKIAYAIYIVRGHAYVSDLCKNAYGIFTQLDK